MPKENRKRKLKHSNGEIEFEVIPPKNKFRPFDEVAQAEEEQLSKILFGGTSDFLTSLEEAENESSALANANIDSGVGEEESDDSVAGYRKPAWTDDDDDGIEVGQALNAQHRKLPSGGINDRSKKYTNLLKHKFISITGTPKWASLKKVEGDSDSDDGIQTCGFIRNAAKESLPQSILEYKKVNDLNCQTYNEGSIISCVEFHPTSSVALVGGNAGIASLIAVDGKQNDKLHSVAFTRYPIYCAKFIQNGNEAIIGSRKSHIFLYDLLAAKAVRISLPPGLTQCKKFVTSEDSKYIAVSGKWGEVHLLSIRSKERISILKQDSEVTALTFHPNGRLLYGHSDSGEVTVWDMNMCRVKHKWMDEGCLKGSAIAVSMSNQFIATGSAQGIVNLYDMEDIAQNPIPKPQKTILNLTTGITDLKFNPTSEALGFCTNDLENSIRLLHVRSGTVFQNFPTFDIKLGHINVLNFSPGSGYIALGNKKSTVSLYRLNHFKNY